MLILVFPASNQQVRSLLHPFTSLQSHSFSFDFDFSLVWGLVLVFPALYHLNGSWLATILLYIPCLNSE